MGFKEERIKSGFTQSMVAKKLGTSRVTVSRWESGINDPDLDTVRELSRLYGCTTDDLLNPTLPSAAELASASAGFEVDVETVIDIGLDGRLDCPERRARAERLMGALSAVM